MLAGRSDNLVIARSKDMVMWFTCEIELLATIFQSCLPSRDRG